MRGLKLTLKEVLNRIKLKHLNRYGLSLITEIKSNKDLVSIICPDHGKIKMRLHHLMSGHGCKRCSIRKMADGLRKTQKEFELEMLRTHKNLYDFSKFIYRGVSKKGIVICNKHGRWEATAGGLKKHGCPRCATEKTHYKQRFTTSEFISRCEKKRKNFYDLFDPSLVKYGRSNVDKVIFICKKYNHGKFYITPMDFLGGHGCPTCSRIKKSSTAEIIAKHWADSKGIDYIEEAKFNSCTNIRKLPFDFYFPKLNILLELDGHFHFKPNMMIKDRYKRELAFKKHKKNDLIKTKWAKDNGYSLLRIKYTKFNKIEDILNKNIKF